MTRDVTEPAKIRICRFDRKNPSDANADLSPDQFFSTSYYSYCDSTQLLLCASLITQKSHTINVVFILIK